MSDSFRHLKNQAGISLVEIMVSASIIVVVALSVANLSTHTTTVLRQINQKNEILEVSKAVGTLTADRAACGIMIRRALGGNALTTPNFGNIDLPMLEQCNPAAPGTCNQIISMAAPNLNSGTRISSIQLRADPTGAPSDPIKLRPPTWSTAAATVTPANPAIDYNRIRARLVIDFDRQANQVGGIGGFQSITKNIDLLVNPANGQPDLCLGQQESPESTCRDLMGGIYDVTRTPACQVSSIALNDQALWQEDLFGNKTSPATLVVGQRTVAGSAFPGSNLVLTGTNPGFTFGNAVGAGAAPPPLDSGSGAMSFNSATGQFAIRGGTNGQVVLTSLGAAGAININAGDPASPTSTAMRLEGNRVVLNRVFYATQGIADPLLGYSSVAGPTPPPPPPPPPPPFNPNCNCEGLEATESEMIALDETAQCTGGNWNLIQPAPVMPPPVPVPTPLAPPPPPPPPPASGPGICGIHNGEMIIGPPTYLCTQGTATAPVLAGTSYTWMCNGIASGDSAANCSATDYFAHVQAAEPNTVVWVCDLPP